LATFTLALVFGACGGEPSEDPLDYLVEDLLERTVPECASHLVVRPIRRSESGVTAEWMFRLEKEPAAYRRWLLDRMRGYTVVGDSDTLLSYRRSDPGDTYWVEVRPASGAALGVSVQFRGHPNQEIGPRVLP
jgi:hypothetical protein